MTKFLYYIQQDNVYRTKVTKETDKFYFVHNGSTKVSKEKLSYGKGWDKVNLYEETQELLDKCKRTFALHTIRNVLYELKDKDFSKLSDERLCEILSFIDKITAEVSENE